MPIYIYYIMTVLQQICVIQVLEEDETLALTWSKTSFQEPGDTDFIDTELHYFVWMLLKHERLSIPDFIKY